MRELVENGPLQHPGQNISFGKMVKGLGWRMFAKASEIHLEYGYKIERHLQDGDLIIFNKQPSLHKMSMMGHRIKIMPYSTFRLNISVTTPYNVDFDGDEMNMHIPQSLETRAEILELMMVSKQIISPKDNSHAWELFRTLCWVVDCSQEENFYGKGSCHECTYVAFKL